MRMWPRRFLIILAVAIVSGIAWQMWQLASEPMYKGKRLSVWLKEYAPLQIDPNFPTIGNGANEALRSLGTNAVPTLLRMLRAKDSELIDKLVISAGKQHWINFNYESEADKNYQAAAAFAVLGPSASNAVPELIKIYKEKISPESECLTANAIGYIGPAASQAIPALLQGLNSTNDVDRGIAVWALGKIHSQPELVIPELAKLLLDPAARVSREAVAALKEFGTSAEVVGAILREQHYRPEAIADALKRFDPKAVTK